MALENLSKDDIMEAVKGLNRDLLKSGHHCIQKPDSIPPALLIGHLPIKPLGDSKSKLKHFADYILDVAGEIPTGVITDCLQKKKPDYDKLPASFGLKGECDVGYHLSLFVVKSDDGNCHRGDLCPAPCHWLPPSQSPIQSSC